MAKIAKKGLPEGLKNWIANNKKKVIGGAVAVGAGVGAVKGVKALNNKLEKEDKYLFHTGN